MITRDKVLNGAQMTTLMGGVDHHGERFAQPMRVRDAATGGYKTVDSTGAFLVGELERLDQTMHQPLSSISWERDLPIRTDVSLGDEVTSFTQSTFGTPSGAGTGAAVGMKRSAIGKKSTELPEMEIDIDKIESPLLPWGEGVAFSLPELASSAQTGRPIDAQKVAALEREFQLQTDAQAYLGWTGNGTYGLINSNQITPTNFPNGTGGHSNWAPNGANAAKTAGEILTDLASIVYAPWAASGFAVKPNRVLLDPNNYNYIRITPATTAGSKSILQYFLESYNSDNQDEPLRILPLKWLTGAGSGGSLLTPNSINRAVAYHKFEGGWQNAYVRFPFLTLARTPIQFDGLWHKFYYWTRMGACEFVYPETVSYMDGN